MPHREPFVFYTERRLVALTGRKARNLPELTGHLREVSGASIFYHTHHTYLAHHFETPIFTNDFASWASEALQEEALSERLAGVDLLAYTTVHDLRLAIIDIIEKAIGAAGATRECPPGDEFYFCRSKSFIMKTGLVAANPAEFFALLPRVSNESLFFHFFEARLRLGRPSNDFSNWFAGRGETRLAERLDIMDPYRTTLDEFRGRIIDLASLLEHRG